MPRHSLHALLNLPPSLRGSARGAEPAGGFATESVRPGATASGPAAQDAEGEAWQRRYAAARGALAPEDRWLLEEIELRGTSYARLSRELGCSRDVIARRVFESRAQLVRRMA